MVGKGLYVSAIGIVIGLLASFAATRVLASMLVEVETHRSDNVRIGGAAVPLGSGDGLLASRSKSIALGSNHRAAELVASRFC
jgi:hypothetical protein